MNGEPCVGVDVMTDRSYMTRILSKVPARGRGCAENLLKSRVVVCGAMSYAQAHAARHAAHRMGRCTQQESTGSAGEGRGWSSQIESCAIRLTPRKRVWHRERRSLGERGRVESETLKTRLTSGERVQRVQRVRDRFSAVSKSVEIRESYICSDYRN